MLGHYVSNIVAYRDGGDIICGTCASTKYGAAVIDRVRLGLTTKPIPGVSKVDIDRAGQTECAVCERALPTIDEANGF